MKTLRLLGLAAGLAALAACGKGNEENNMANADLNAATTENLAVPADNMATNVDMNAGATNDTNTTSNNTSDNTVNAY